MPNSKLAIGTALDQLTADVKTNALRLVSQARAQPEPYTTALMKQAVDTPHRARAQIMAWLVEYNVKNGAGTAQTLLQQCLTAAGSTATLASIDAALAVLEAQCLVLVNHVKNDGWTWVQVATAMEAAIPAVPVVAFDYSQLPIPAGYVTVWGQPW